MGIYKRPDSKFWWIWLEGNGRKGLRLKTRLLIDAGSPAQTAENKRLAEALHARRLADQARKELADGSDSAESPRRGHRADQWTYVYFIRLASAVKIGRAINVTKRLQSLQVGQPERLEVLAVVPGHVGLEREIQRRFATLLISGEWYRFEEPLCAFIARVQAGEHPVAVLAAVHSRSTNGQATIGPVLLTKSEK